MFSLPLSFNHLATQRVNLRLAAFAQPPVIRPRRFLLQIGWLRKETPRGGLGGGNQEAVRDSARIAAAAPKGSWRGRSERRRRRPRPRERSSPVLPASSLAQPSDSESVGFLDPMGNSCLRYAFFSIIFNPTSAAELARWRKSWQLVDPG